MKIAITATEPTLQAALDPRFGRCPCFVLIETDTMQFEPLSNATNARGSSAGIQTAQMLAQLGVTTVLTGNCGPNAHQTLTAAGIAVIVSCSGTISEVIARFKSGELHPSAEPNVTGHSGKGLTTEQGHAR